MEVSYAPPGKTSITPLLFGLFCLALGTAILLGACATPAKLADPAPLRPVERVDLARYAGKWYEIAAYPAWFQQKCVGGTTAEYLPQADGSLRVINRCLTRDGQPQQSVGRATVVPGSGNAKLRVKFDGVPFVTGDYWILALDEKDYAWALVGHPSRDYLWILAREPRLSPARYDEIVALAVAQSYDPARLRRTDQSRNLPPTTP